MSRTTEIAVRDKPRMHDFALTEKYVVLYDLPATFNPDAAEAGRFPYVWNPAHEARVGLLSREDSSREPRWFTVEPCFVFIRLTRTTAVIVSSSTCAATQEVTMFRGWPDQARLPSIAGPSIP